MACEEKGLTMAEMRSYKDMEQMKTFLNDTILAGTISEDVRPFIGAYYDPNRQGWKWDSDHTDLPKYGSEATGVYQNWKRDLTTQSFTDGDCIKMGKNGKWRVLPCNSDHSAVLCHYPIVSGDLIVV